MPIHEHFESTSNAARATQVINQSFLKLSTEERILLIRKLQLYFSEELDQKLGQFDAEFFLDFIAAELGVYYYNQGLLDAQAVLLGRVESITEAIDEIMKPAPE